MSQTVEQQGSEYPVNPDFDPLDRDYLADPYPYFARFRSETPVFYAPKIDFWVVSRYEDVQDIVKDPETFSNARVQEPLHHAARAFSAKRGAGLEGRIREIANGLIDDVIQEGCADLVDRFAFPLPASVGALRRYEALRADRTADIVRRSRRVGTVGQLENPFLCWLRDRTLKMVPAETPLRQIQEVVGGTRSRRAPPRGGGWLRRITQMDDAPGCTGRKYSHDRSIIVGSEREVTRCFWRSSSCWSASWPGWPSACCSTSGARRSARRR